MQERDYSCGLHGRGHQPSFDSATAEYKSVDHLFPFLIVYYHTLVRDSDSGCSSLLDNQKDGVKDGEKVKNKRVHNDNRNSITTIEFLHQN